MAVEDRCRWHNSDHAGTLSLASKAFSLVSLASKVCTEEEETHILHNWIQTQAQWPMHIQKAPGTGERHLSGARLRR